jgi:pleiotropic regulator 1
MTGSSAAGEAPRGVVDAVEQRAKRTRLMFPREPCGNKYNKEVFGLEHLKALVNEQAEDNKTEEEEEEEKEEHVKEDQENNNVRASVKWRSEYEFASTILAQDQAGSTPEERTTTTTHQQNNQHVPGAKTTTGSRDLVVASSSSFAQRGNQPSQALVGLTSTTKGSHEYSASLIRRQAGKWPRPEWHAPWKLYRVVSGHLGWVRSIAFDPSNDWFVTGSADRCIKVWDLASGRLKLTLTGHIEQVTGLAVSPRHPYLFSCGLDKQVKCWDLEYNKVIRHYHGHLSGVYSLCLHPNLDIMFTGGRDSTCRVWDMRTKAQVHVLTGHENTVCSILSQGSDPQVITGSHDSQIKLWDLVAAKPMTTLTHHKKGVRCMGLHPKEYAFASCSSDNIKKFSLPRGNFMHNMLQPQRTVVNAMCVNDDGVMATCADNGNMWFWDWNSGNKFQEIQSPVQPGSLDSESGIFAASFDVTGTRLLTCEADKTIKFYKEDLEATPETHPVQFKPPKDIRRY